MVYSCPVCYKDPFVPVDGETPAVMTLDVCHHLFCQKCIDQWKKTCREKQHDATCPMCSQVFAKKGDKSVTTGQVTASFRSVLNRFGASNS